MPARRRAAGKGNSGNNNPGNGNGPKDPGDNTGKPQPIKPRANTQVPIVDVQCTNDQCSKYDVVVACPVGVVLTPGVLMVGTLSCMECGMQMQPLALSS